MPVSIVLQYISGLLLCVVLVTMDRSSEQYEFLDYPRTLLCTIMQMVDLVLQSVALCKSATAAVLPGEPDIPLAPSVSLLLNTTHMPSALVSMQGITQQARFSTIRILGVELVF